MTRGTALVPHNYSRPGGGASVSSRLSYNLHLEPQNLFRTRDPVQPRLLSGQVELAAKANES